MVDATAHRILTLWRAEFGREVVSFSALYPALARNLDAPLAAEFDRTSSQRWGPRKVYLALSELRRKGPVGGLMLQYRPGSYRVIELPGVWCHPVAMPEVTPADRARLAADYLASKDRAAARLAALWLAELGPDPIYLVDVLAAAGELPELADAIMLLCDVRSLDRVSARKLAMNLLRAQDRGIAGYTLQRAGRDTNGILWCAQKTAPAVTRQRVGEAEAG